jgi:hypothetical protein
VTRVFRGVEPRALRELLDDACYIDA